jgi:hypothetical protein
MIEINFHKQVGLPGKEIEYSWDGRILTAKLIPDNITEVFDLSSLEPGDEIETTEVSNFPFPPLIAAKVLDDNTLVVDLLFWVDNFYVDIPERVFIEE